MVVFFSLSCLFYLELSWFSLQNARTRMICIHVFACLCLRSFHFHFWVGFFYYHKHLTQKGSKQLNFLQRSTREWWSLTKSSGKKNTGTLLSEERTGKIENSYYKQTPSALILRTFVPMAGMKLAIGILSSNWLNPLKWTG